MKFKVSPNPNEISPELVYLAAEYSLLIEPDYPGGGIGTLLLNFIELDLCEKDYVQYICGYCPLIAYSETKKFPEDLEKGQLFPVLKEPVLPGVAIGINESYPGWPLYKNESKGWYCLGDPDTSSMKLVEFAPSCVAGLRDDEMVALWLKPKII